MKRSRALPAWAMALLTIAALGLLSACSREGGFGSNAEASEVLGSSELRIESVSTRPYLVTGGDVLLRIRAGEDLDLSQIRVSANGEDVTGGFSFSAHGGALIGLVQELRMGHNEIEARIPGSEVAAALELTNYPISGPIISGPHEMPFLCQTEEFTTAAGESLGPPLDENCSVETRVEYVYLSTLDDEFKAYGGSRAAAMPADMAEATTLDGKPCRSSSESRREPSTGRSIRAPCSTIPPIPHPTPGPEVRVGTESWCTRTVAAARAVGISKGTRPDSYSTRVCSEWAMPSPRRL